MQIHPYTEQVIQYLKQLQDNICDGFMTVDNHLKLTEDEWERPDGGGGRTRAFSAGNIIEQGGVNFSHVYGKTLPPSASANRPQLAGAPFEATGVSLVLHTVNPYVPAVHMNVRFFIAHTEEPVWWFGGGFDLTPYYGFDEDCIHWHQTARQACEPFGQDVYSEYKKWCDDYFYLKHRDEHRGVGGIFFDDRNEGSFEDNLRFMKSVGDHFLEGYLPIVERRKDTPFDVREKSFQKYRRGRYAEFNLVYDRGTLFGLQSGGRTESILVSMPPEAEWRYQWQPEANTPEAKLTEYYLKPRAWV